MFKSSNNGGLSFSEKANPGNKTDIESVDAEITADGENVLLPGWGGMRTSIHTARTRYYEKSNNANNTFRSILNLAQTV